MAGPRDADALAELAEAEEAVALAQELVRTPSVVGEEGELARLLRARMEGMGFDRVFEQEVEPGRPNVIGVADSGRAGPTLVLTGHIDTKPVCKGWDSDPYSGRIEAGVAALVAAGAAMARARSTWAGTVLVAAVVDHMGQQRGAIRFFQEQRGDYCILGELTDLKIYLGHRGRLYWTITSTGRSAHTCHRDQAVNAIAKMVPLIEEIERLRWMPDVPDEIAELFGSELYMAVGRIWGGLPPGGPSMIPDDCTILIDSRPHPGIEPEQVETVLRQAMDRAQARDPEARYDLELVDRKAPHLIERDHLLVRTLAEAYRAVVGSEPEYGGGSWLADTASTGHLLPTVIFGPGREPVYMPNEWLAVEDIHLAARVYTVTAGRLLAGDD
ncbi:MAG: M20 family metallopeptidase [Actinobacteria bacterium]|nr:MAG: M20 family metallopeptidase [Actinomycetota bacterium]